MDRFRLGALLAVLVVPTATVGAQDRDALLARADALRWQAPAEALASLQSILDTDSLDYEANWRAAVGAVELGQDIADSRRTARQDSLYRLAERYARRAVRVDTTDVNGWFALSMALGRAALTRGPRTRIAYAREVFEAATRAARLDPTHDGVQHVLGLWHFEVMSISGVNRFLARNILGGKVLGQASWAGALRHLQRAVILDPTRLYHRLDYARVLARRKQYLEAQNQLGAIDSLPDRVRLDPRYREEARALRRQIGSESGDPAEPSRELLEQ